MSSSADLVAVLKASGITYARLATRLEMAESSVKRIFSRIGDLPLSQVNDICRALALDSADLKRPPTRRPPFTLALGMRSWLMAAFRDCLRDQAHWRTSPGD